MPVGLSPASRWFRLLASGLRRARLMTVLGLVAIASCASVGAAELHAALTQRYAGERFIRVMPLCDAATLADGFFDVQACNDTNRVDLFVFASEAQVLLMARLDNLGKGASGAAVQAMNVHLGVDETLGL